MKPYFLSSLAGGARARRGGGERATAVSARTCVRGGACARAERAEQARACAALDARRVRARPPLTVAARDHLELVHGELARVDGDAALGAAVGHVDDGALVGHEAGERLDLLQVHLVGEADAALAGQAVVAVLRAVAAHHLRAAVVAVQREVDAQQRVARLDDLEQARLDARELRRRVEVHLDHLEEARLGVRRRHGARRVVRRRGLRARGEEEAGRRRGRAVSAGARERERERGREVEAGAHREAALRDDARERAAEAEAKHFGVPRAERKRHS